MPKLVSVGGKQEDAMDEDPPEPTFKEPRRCQKSCLLEDEHGGHCKPDDGSPACEHQRQKWMNQAVKMYQAHVGKWEGGRPPKLSHRETVFDICQHCRVSRSALYRALAKQNPNAKKKPKPKSEPDDLAVVVMGWNLQLKDWTEALAKVEPHKAYLEQYPKIADEFKKNATAMSAQLLKVAGPLDTGKVIEVGPKAPTPPQGKPPEETALAVWALTMRGSAEELLKRAGNGPVLLAKLAHPVSGSLLAALEAAIVAQKACESTAAILDEFNHQAAHDLGDENQPSTAPH